MERSKDSGRGQFISSKVFGAPLGSRSSSGAEGRGLRQHRASASRWRHIHTPGLTLALHLECHAQVVIHQQPHRLAPVFQPGLVATGVISDGKEWPNTGLIRINGGH